MMIFTIFAALLIVVVLVNEYYQARLGVPCMPTVPGVRRRMISLIPEDARHVVELGSGWGGVAIAAARAQPGCRVTGVEYSLFPFLMARLRLLLHPGLKNLRFARRDFFSFPLNDADVVLCYLTNPLMEKLRPKFIAELPPRARIVSSTFILPNWTEGTEGVGSIRGLWHTRVFVYEKGGEVSPSGPHIPGAG